MSENTTTIKTDPLQPTRDRCHALLDSYLQTIESSVAVQHAAMLPAIAADDNAIMKCQTLSLDFMETGNNFLKLISIVAAVGEADPGAVALKGEIRAAQASAAEGWAEVQAQLVNHKN